MRVQPGAKLRYVEDGENQAGDECPGERQDWSGTAGSVSVQLRLAFVLRRQCSGISGRWASTWIAVTPIHTMKLALWISSSDPRELGPASSRATPLANTKPSRPRGRGRAGAERSEGPLSPVAGIGGVVTDESVTRAPHLQGDGRNQQQPEEHVLAEERPDSEDRHAQGREEDEEDCPGGRGELLVAGRAARRQASEQRGR